MNTRPLFRGRHWLSDRHRLKAHRLRHNHRSGDRRGQDGLAGGSQLRHDHRSGKGLDRIVKGLDWTGGLEGIVKGGLDWASKGFHRTEGLDWTEGLHRTERWTTEGLNRAEGLDWAE